MAKAVKQDMGKLLAGAVVLLVFAGIAYFFISSETSKNTIPGNVTGEMRTIYEWARTPDGKALLEQLPCYCGCRFEGHLHARHCFWRDNGDFDKHGITCAVCLDIAKKAKALNADGKSVCEIRDDIDAFYAPNKDLSTPTPYPVECAQ
mgnify:FL=1